MSTNDDALAATAVGLNEDAKASRRKRGGTAALDAGKAHLSGDPGAPPEGGAEMHDALGDLGDAVAAQPDAATGGYDLSEGAHRLAVDRIEGLVMEQRFDGKTLVFDVRDTMLSIIKARPKPWSATSQDEQQDIAAALEQASIRIVRRIAETIASDGKEPVRVLLTKVNIADDIVITGKLKVLESEAEDRAVTMLHHARGKHVLLIPASVDDYRETDRPAETDADQPGFGFEAGRDEHPDDDSDLGPDNGEEQD